MTWYVRNYSTFYQFCQGGRLDKRLIICKNSGVLLERRHIMTYGSQLLGHTYKVKGGIPFTVLGIEGYPDIDIKKQYKPQLVGLEKDQLVAVPYRTTLIPNITMGDGVARITKVVVAGVTYIRPIDISKAIGITAAYNPQTLEKLG